MPTRPNARSRRRRALRVAGAGAVLLLLCGLLGIYGRYETTHDIPNPFWATFNRTLTYTPDQGPPGGGLLLSRPDVIVRQYLADYIRLAGTYPCAQDRDHYHDNQDRFLLGQPCGVNRPVGSFAVISVTIAPPRCDCGPAMATVAIHVAYADGSRWDVSMPLYPDEHDTYWLTYTHMTCWSLYGILSLYPARVSPPPAGAEYPKLGPDGQTVEDYACEP